MAAVNVIQSHAPHLAEVSKAWLSLAGDSSAVLKSPADTRSYRPLVLENQLRVLLISDSETDKSAAAMDVSVGQKEMKKNLHRYRLWIHPSL